MFASRRRVVFGQSPIFIHRLLSRPRNCALAPVFLRPSPKFTRAGFHLSNSDPFCTENLRAGGSPADRDDREAKGEEIESSLSRGLAGQTLWDREQPILQCLRGWWEPPVLR